MYISPFSCLLAEIARVPGTALVRYHQVHRMPTGRCLWPSMTTTRAQRTIWASGRGTFSTSSTRKKATGGMRNTKTAETRGSSPATTLPNTSHWMPKSELNGRRLSHPPVVVVKGPLTHKIFISSTVAMLQKNDH